MDKKTIIKLVVGISVVLAGVFLGSNNPQIVSAISANQHTIECFLDSAFGVQNETCIH